MTNPDDSSSLQSALDQLPPTNAGTPNNALPPLGQAVPGGNLGSDGRIDLKTFNPYDSTSDYVKAAALPQARQDAFKAQQAWAALQDSGQYIVGKDGTVYKQVEKAPPTTGPDSLNLPVDTNGNPIPTYTQGPIDQKATAIYKASLAADQRVSDINAALKAGIGGAATTAGSYVANESAKTDEAKKEFLDALDRMKAVYSLEDADQAYAMRAQDQNIQEEQAMKAGNLDFGMSSVFTGDRGIPAQDSYSNEIAKTVPAQVTPDYQLGGSVGLPGQTNGFQPSDNQNTQVPLTSVHGYALGTPAPRSPKDGVDPEIAWMIGMPDIFVDPKQPIPPQPESWKARAAGGVA